MSDATKLAPPGRLVRIEGAGLVACAAVLVAALAAGTLARHGGGEEGLRVLTRVTARAALLLFTAAYAASSLRRLWPVPATAWLLRNRRYVGLSFAVAHAFHLLAVLGLATLLGDAFEYDAVSLGFGGLAYLFVAALAATSSDRAAAALGPARWRMLHRIGVHYVWFIFAVTEIPTALHSPQHFAMAGLVVGGAALRVAAARAAPRRPPPLQAR